MTTTTIWGIIVLGILISFIGGLSFAILSAANSAAKEKANRLNAENNKQ